jgi:Fe-Mn family superoxide dismutase
MAHEVPALPYAYDALEPHYDEATVRIHHDKHHQTYVDRLNAALEGHPDLQSKSVEELLSDLKALPDQVRTPITNHGGGHFNHSLFWRTMGPNKGGQPSGRLGDAINAQFGGFEAFQKQFSDSAAALFGSGWTYLVADSGGKLAIRNFANQECPLSEGLKPLLLLDVWEHAYYLKFQNRRAEWIAAWWNIVNWDEVSANYG